MPFQSEALTRTARRSTWHSVKCLPRQGAFANVKQDISTECARLDAAGRPTVTTAVARRGYLSVAVAIVEAPPAFDTERAANCVGRAHSWMCHICAVMRDSCARHQLPGVMNAVSTTKLCASSLYTLAKKVQSDQPHMDGAESHGNGVRCAGRCTTQACASHLRAYIWRGWAGRGRARMQR